MDDAIALIRESQEVDIADIEVDEEAIDVTEVDDDK